MHGGNIYRALKDIDRLGMQYETYESLRRKITDFSVNINPFGLSEGIRRRLFESIEDIIYYPYEDVSKLVSERINVPKEKILLGNGATSLIYRLVQSFERPLNALIPCPSFSEYERAINCNVYSNIKYYNMHFNNDGRARIEIEEDFLEYIDEDTDIVFLCNPNNPTGLLTSRNLIADIVKKCEQKNAILCIDECFMDFVEGGENISFMKNVSDSGNIVILRSFTKLYSIPGLRAGFLVSSDKKLLENMKKITPTWDLNCMATVAVKEALSAGIDTDSLNDYIGREREYLSENLADSGFKVFKSHANFILFKDIFGQGLYDSLLREYILIRNCGDYLGLDENYYRIAVRSHEENAKLIECMKKYIREIKWQRK